MTSVWLYLSGNCQCFGMGREPDNKINISRTQLPSVVTKSESRKGRTSQRIKETDKPNHNEKSEYPSQQQSFPFQSTEICQRLLSFHHLTFFSRKPASVSLPSSLVGRTRLKPFRIRQRPILQLAMHMGTSI